MPSSDLKSDRRCLLRLDRLHDGASQVPTRSAAREPSGFGVWGLFNDYIVLGALSLGLALLLVVYGSYFVRRSEFKVASGGSG